MNKQTQELTKELLVKRIIKFFNKFKEANFIPIILNKKYLKYFLDIFETLNSKFQKRDSKNINDSSASSKKNPNHNKQIFSNIIFYPLNNQEKLDSNEINIFLNKFILNNLTEKISIYQIDENEIISYKINQIGKMFKLSRLKDTLKDIQKISNTIYLEENNNIIIYIININRLK